LDTRAREATSFLPGPQDAKTMLKIITEARSK
jgi:hypothetical protein